MRAYPKDFDDKAILVRHDLYRRLCQIIWDPTRLGFAVPETRQIADPAHRARTHFGIDVPRLMSAGLLKAGDTLVAVHLGAEQQAIILDDGRIKLAGGEPFSSLSRAAAYAKRSKTANRWSSGNFRPAASGDRSKNSATN